MVAPRRTINRARELRGKMTLPEVLLWNGLRGGRLEGLRFRRQHPFGPYILDFYCEPAKLAVEVDGMGHRMGDQPDFDRRRDAWLAERGVRVLRFEAADVLQEVEPVLATILNAARPKAPSDPSGNLPEGVRARRGPVGWGR